MKKTFFLLGLMFSMITAASAQTSPVTDKLQNQFSQLKTKANNYREHKREYKVIEVNQLNAFWSGVLSTVRSHENEMVKGGKDTHAALLQARETIEAQNTEISALKKENALKEEAVQRNAYEVNNILIFGLGINKQFFMFFSFGLIAGLIILAAVIFSLYKKNKKITDEKIQAFQEIDHEFNEFKKAARERELKIKRELQTELNHKEEMRLQLASLQK